MTTMLGALKSRSEHGALECSWGCCRSLITGDKAKTRRILRTRDNRAWRNDERNEQRD